MGRRTCNPALKTVTVALEQLGLDRERDDIDIAPVGDPPQIVQALEDGLIDGAVLSRGHARQMVAKGFSVLLDLSPAHVYGAQDALVTTGEFLEEHPVAIEGLIAGLIEGAAYVQSDAGKAVTLETIKAELRITDDAAAEAGRVQLAQCLQRKPYPSVDRLRNMQRIMSTVEPDVTAIDVGCLIDDRFVARLDSRGFIDIVYRDLKVS